jgi:hypothetical protein
MGEQRQSQGREDNAASPVEDWEASGIMDTKQKSDAESTGRDQQVTGEDKSFQDVGGGQHQTVDEQKMMREVSETDPNDLQGPAGDPVEGPRNSSTYPS